MARESLQGFLRLGMWLAVCGLLMALILGVSIMIRWFARRTPVQEDDGDDWHGAA